MRPLDDSGKYGWTVTDFSVMMRRLARSDWKQTDWGRIDFSDDMFPDDHQRRVWRRPRQRADTAFTIERRTCLQK
ncbi:hypothetical protein TNCV_1894411 [Trichonephila clavipes]|nr:hypothetical protein TNCV_1894411 [Trichonephila clavipes]